MANQIAHQDAAARDLRPTFEQRYDLVLGKMVQKLRGMDKVEGQRKREAKDIGADKRYAGTIPDLSARDAERYMEGLLAYARPIAGPPSTSNRQMPNRGGSRVAIAAAGGAKHNTKSTGDRSARSAPLHQSGGASR